MSSKKSVKTCFTANFLLKNSFFGYGRIDLSHQCIVKFRIFYILSFIFESGVIRRFQRALMGPKTSVETCFMGNSPLKNSILRSKTPIKVKEKS